MMKKIYDKEIKEIERELEELYPMRRQAGVETDGSYDNKINRLEKQRKELLEKLNEETLSTSILKPYKTLKVI